MNYLRDRQKDKKKKIQLAVALVFLLVVFLLRNPFFAFFSNVGHYILRPILTFGRGTEMGVGEFFKSQNNLEQEIIRLQSELDKSTLQLASFKEIELQNKSFQEILNRKYFGDELVLAGILAKPNRSLYDTLIIDAGEKDGVSLGDLVLASGDVPIGKIEEVYNDSSKVVLFSSPDVRTEVVISEQNIFLEAIGRGGGNFEITLPRDIDVPSGTVVMLPGVESRVIASVSGKISDPRDAFNKILLVMPINIQNLRFVQVKIN